MKKYVQTNRKNILIFIGILIGITILLMPTNTQKYEVEYKNNPRLSVESKKLITEEEKVNYILDQKSDSIKFLADAFLISNEILREKLKTNYLELNFLEDSDNFDKIVLEYLFELETNEKELFDTKRISNTMNKDYIVKVLRYFCKLYPNVDFTIAASIAQIESGYTVKHMLKKNNIFGGIYSGSLIEYKTIEYGTLKYVKLLSEGYFGKGLTTVEDIGKVYNPTFDENNTKIANPLWVTNVNNAMEQFLEIPEVDTSMLISLKNEEELLAN